MGDSHARAAAGVAQRQCIAHGILMVIGTGTICFDGCDDSVTARPIDKLAQQHILL